MRKKISIILVILGVIVVMVPVAGQLYTKYQEDKMMSEWLNSIDVQTTEATSDVDPEEAYSELQQAFLSENGTDSTAEEAASVTASENAGTPTNKNSGASGPKKPAPQQTVLGIMQIKKIKVKAPIVEGVKDSNLRMGVGHVPGTAGLGQAGNCAIAGHRSYTFGKFFNRLDELVIGDQITITTKKEDLYYKVTKISVVKPDDVSVLKGTKDKNYITLITCTPIYVASHRLIVNAELSERILKEP